MTQKKCFKCGEQKPLDDFYKHPTMGDGHLGKCKVCTKQDVRVHRRNNDSVREYDRRRYHTSPGRKQRTAASAQKWALAHPDRRKAITQANNAVRDGRLKKPLGCSQCGSEGHIHGHHDDYSKPLDVRWLCVRCHALHHAGA